MTDHPSGDEPLTAADVRSIVREERDRTADGAHVARPGTVQATLDEAAAGAGGEVRLVSGETYRPTQPLEIPRDVVLDCRGAWIELTRDEHGFALHERCQVRFPRVSTTGVDGYSSSVFRMAPVEFDEHVGAGNTMPTWTVYGGWSDMTPDEGTCIELRGDRRESDGEYDVATDNRNVYFTFISHNCTGGRRFAWLHREGPSDTERGGHVNGNLIRGFARETTRFVETDDSSEHTNMVNGNKFYLATQPRENTSWLWYAKKGAYNELVEWGHNWDYARTDDHDGDGYPDNWYIGPAAGSNYVWRKVNSASGGLGGTVIDDSDGESGSKYLTLDQMGTPVEAMDVWADAV